MLGIISVQTNSSWGQFQFILMRSLWAGTKPPAPPLLMRDSFGDQIKPQAPGPACWMGRDHAANWMLHGNLYMPHVPQVALLHAQASSHRCTRTPPRSLHRQIQHENPLPGPPALEDASAAQGLLESWSLGCAEGRVSWSHSGLNFSRTTHHSWA